MNLNSYLDFDFIENIYFENFKKKDEFISSIKEVLEFILDENDMLSAILLEKYIINCKTTIPFLTESLKFDLSNCKLDNYYINHRLIKYNVSEKLFSKTFNFEFEEKLLANTFKFDHRNYARIETLFILGDAFSRKNDFIKMDIYFDIIYEDVYEINNITVSNFYRSIGDVYLICDNKRKALKFYRSGLKLNPKLGVKKNILNLEKEF